MTGVLLNMHRLTIGEDIQRSNLSDLHSEKKANLCYFDGCDILTIWSINTVAKESINKVELTFSNLPLLASDTIISFSRGKQQANANKIKTLK